MRRMGDRRCIVEEMKNGDFGKGRTGEKKRSIRKRIDMRMMGE